NTDARRFLHSLTAKGRHLLEQVAPAFNPVYQEIESRFGVQRIEELNRRLAELLEAAPLPDDEEGGTVLRLQPHSPRLLAALPWSRVTTWFMCSIGSSAFSMQTTPAAGLLGLPGMSYWPRMQPSSAWRIPAHSSREQALAPAGASASATPRKCRCC